MLAEFTDYQFYKLYLVKWSIKIFLYSTGYSWYEPAFACIMIVGQIFSLNLCLNEGLRTRVV